MKFRTKIALVRLIGSLLLGFMVGEIGKAMHMSIGQSLLIGIPIVLAWSTGLHFFFECDE